MGFEGHERRGTANIPNLSHIIETHVPVASREHAAHLEQLRRDVLPHVRKLQADGHIRWFSFLLHPANQLFGHDPRDENAVIHLRLEMTGDLDLQKVAEILPVHFLKPTRVELSNISGLDDSELRGHDWARAWRLDGAPDEVT